MGGWCEKAGYYFVLLHIIYKPSNSTQGHVAKQQKGSEGVCVSVAIYTRECDVHFHAC